MFKTMTSTVYIGVDPGKDGAMALLWGDQPLVIPFDRKEYIEILKTMLEEYRAVAAIEHVGGLPGQSAPASFNFGENAGFIHGVFEALAIPYELVRPQKWKKEFSCTSDKNTSIAVAKRLFPNVDLRRTERCTKAHDGKAEALLLAEYCRRRMP